MTPPRATAPGDQTQQLLFALIRHLTAAADPSGGTILVFLPTYRTLEEQYGLLDAAGG